MYTGAFLYTTQVVLDFSKTILRHKKEGNTQMKEIRLHEGELNVMELLWSNKALAAKDISKIIKEYIGWEKNTTYTVIKRLIDKGAVVREDPGFICRAAITKKAVQKIETQALLNKLYNGSLVTFFTEYIKYQNIPTPDLLEMERVIAAKKDK